MSNYTKFTLDTIRMKLKAGEYESLVGANRAIGKTKDLSPEDKEKAKILAAKHFGADAPVAKSAKAAKGARAPKAPVKRKKAAKKAAKPAAAVAATKKVAKKTKRKAGKRAPRVSEESAPAPSPAAAAPAVSEAKVKTGGAKKAAAVEAPPAYGESTAAVLRDMVSTITSIDQALKSMEAAKRLFPKADLERNVELAVTAMGRAVSVLEATLTPLLPPDAQKPQAVRGKRGKSPDAPAAPAGAEGAVTHVEEAVAEAHSEPVEQQEAAESPSVEEEGSADEGLTEDEKAQATYARQTRPAYFTKRVAPAGNSTT